MNPIFRRPIRGCIMIQDTRILVPLYLWKKIGDPAGADIFLDHWDLFLKAGRMVAKPMRNFVAIKLPGTAFPKLIKSGDYAPEQYQIVEIGGMTLLKIKSANQFCIDEGSLQNWKAARNKLRSGV